MCTAGRSIKNYVALDIVIYCESSDTRDKLLSQLILRGEHHIYCASSYIRVQLISKWSFFSLLALHTEFEVWHIRVVRFFVVVAIEVHVSTHVARSLCGTQLSQCVPPDVAHCVVRFVIMYRRSGILCTCSPVYGHTDSLLIFRWTKTMSVAERWKIGSCIENSHSTIYHSKLGLFSLVRSFRFVYQLHCAVINLSIWRMIWDEQYIT